MALDVYELRTEDAVDAAALWQGQGLTPAFDVVRRAGGVLVLVAREAGQLVAVAACQCEADKGHVMQVAVAPGDGAEALRRSIIGIALRKLRARGISKCHVAVAHDGDDQEHPFFASLRFTIPPTSSSDAA